MARLSLEGKRKVRTEARGGRFPGPCTSKDKVAPWSHLSHHFGLAELCQGPPFFMLGAGDMVREPTLVWEELTTLERRQIHEKHKQQEQKGGHWLPRWWTGRLLEKLMGAILFYGIILLLSDEQGWPGRVGGGCCRQGVQCKQRPGGRKGVGGTCAWVTAAGEAWLDLKGQDGDDRATEGRSHVPPIKRFGLHGVPP